jgi:hypothetical protein
MVRISSAVLAGAALIASSMAAAAGQGGCATCYQKVVSPPVYQTVAEKVLVQPARTIARHVPAEYGTVAERVMVQPPRTIAHHVPAQYQTVAEKVLVAPASKVWQVSHDAHGREIGCWVTKPAQYAIQHRTVMVRPASVSHEVVPAVYAERHRTVVTRPATVHHEMIPAVYGVRHRQEMVAPASAHWQPVGHGRRAYHY